jgi:hypothetical protein
MLRYRTSYAHIIQTYHLIYTLNEYRLRDVDHRNTTLSKSSSKHSLIYTTLFSDIQVPEVIQINLVTLHKYEYNGRKRRIQCYNTSM